MTQIQPVIFPLNLGTADRITISISANASIPGARISYLLLDSTVTPIKHLSQGFFNLTEEQFIDLGNDKTWVENYVVNQLGIEIISEQE
jgi:hypothetical protein